MSSKRELEKVLVVFPLYAYRRIVIILATNLKPGFHTVVNLDSCLVVCDDIHGRPRNSFCCVLHLKGEPLYEDIVGRVEKVLDGRPELTCSLTRWLSVYFWEKCKNFSISNHISQNEESDPDKLSDFLVNMIEKGYPTGNPLWELIYFPNYAHPKYGTTSAVLLRIHHVLGDGMAYMALLRDIFDPNPTVDQEIENILKTQRTKLKISTWKKLCYLTELIFATPSQTVHYYLKGFYSQVVPMNQSNSGVSGVTHFTMLMDISLIKRISKKTGVKVTSIIHAGVTGAMRRLILEKGGRADGDLSTFYVLPKMNHPGTMTNNSFAIPLISPMTPEPSQAARLARISDQFDRILFSPLPLGMMGMTGLTGLVCGTLIAKPWRVPHVASCVHSNVVFVGEPLRLFGHVAETLILYTGLQPGGHHLFVATISYNGKLMIQLLGSRAAFPERDDVVKFADYVREEFEMLEMDGNAENCDIRQVQEEDKKNA
ncbi:hypothetical protein Fcan01_00036 [Folsomia candida]|uniref:O-acyltransferase WSD1 C-terminal domain-containing protein n=1 Tax=Folsomia candida TaxID=158441 RepID=A0A226EW03_FOLCA|nr:hypothetical protein Fcan01_00036 [Folsomia candida]